MGTKVLFIDDENEIMMDVVQSAYVAQNCLGESGVKMDITKGTSIFIEESDPVKLIRGIWFNDKVDLTSYGPVVWIDEDNNWSDENDSGDTDD